MTSLASTVLDEFLAQYQKSHQELQLCRHFTDARGCKASVTKVVEEGGWCMPHKPLCAGSDTGCHVVISSLSGVPVTAPKHSNASTAPSASSSPASVRVLSGEAVSCVIGDSDCAGVLDRIPTPVTPLPSPLPRQPYPMPYPLPHPGPPDVPGPGFVSEPSYIPILSLGELNQLAEIVGMLFLGRSAYDSFYKRGSKISFQDLYQNHMIYLQHFTIGHAYLSARYQKWLTGKKYFKDHTQRSPAEQIKHTEKDCIDFMTALATDLKKQCAPILKTSLQQCPKTPAFKIETEVK